MPDRLYMCTLKNSRVAVRLRVERETVDQMLRTLVSRVVGLHLPG